MLQMDQFLGSRSDPSLVIRRQVVECDATLPWDFRPETLCHKGAPTKGVSLNDQAFAVITDSMPERIILWTLFTNRDNRRQGLGTKLIEAIAANYPEKAIVTPVALPDTHAPEFLDAVGFKEVSISQFEMAIEL
jgi:GNAT superfamily N-acetyltransferase